MVILTESDRANRVNKAKDIEGIFSRGKYPIFIYITQVNALLTEPPHTDNSEAFLCWYQDTVVSEQIFLALTGTY